VFVQRIRRDGQILEASEDVTIRGGDILAVAGRRNVLVELVGANAEEVNDRELLAVPIEGVDVYVTDKTVDGKTLAELAKLPGARACSCEGLFGRDRNRDTILAGTSCIGAISLPSSDVART